MSKYENLISRLSEYLHNGLCLALSGGVDSGLLAGVISNIKTKSENTDFYAVTFDTPLYSKDEILSAQNLCRNLNIKHSIIKIDFTKMPAEFLRNPKDRCFICKKIMFTKAIEFAHKEKLNTIIDGTNFDDLKTYRPGRKALEELGIKSPLAECGFTKIEIRQLAERLNLDLIYKKPAAPCLATRLPYGSFLDIQLLSKIEYCENFLHKLNFNECRIRFHSPVIRIEIPEKDFIEFLKRKTEIVTVIKKQGFKYITLDIEGLRSGSMDE